MFNHENEKELTKIIFSLKQDQDDKLRGSSDSSSSEEFDDKSKEYFY